MQRKSIVSTISFLASLAVGAALVLPTDGVAGQMSRGGKGHGPSAAPVLPWTIGLGKKRGREHAHGKFRDRGHRWRFDRRDRFDGFIYFPIFGYGDYYDRDSPLALPPALPPPPPEPPVVEAPAEPPPPPDPRGPLRLTQARGMPPAEPPYAVGEALPADLPHVTLDWRQYELPEPPAGRLYARIGRDVLLITEVDRVVEKVVDL